MAELNLALVIFTLLIGVCTGTFVLYSLWLFNREDAGESRQWLSRKVMPALLVCLGVGMLASATHLGKPFRFLNAFSNPGSMIAQEGYWSIALGIILLIAVWLAFKGKELPNSLYVVGSLVSCGLLVVSSLVYVKANGFPAWSSGLTVVYYFSSAALLGMTVVYFLGTSYGKKQEQKKLALIALVIVGIQAVTTLAFAVHLKYNVVAVSLPATGGLDLVRWGVGLVAPAVIAYLSWSGKLDSKKAVWPFVVCVVIGEVFSRLLFFMQGIHL